MKPSLFYAVKPLAINQPFGANYDYYHSHFGTNGHPGIDFYATHATPVYASHTGQAIYLKDAHGGEGIYIYAKGYVTIYWHLIGNTDTKLPTPIPFDNGYHAVNVGDLIGFSDNTGAPFESSGDHLHFGLAFTDSNNQITNKDNGFNGCVDPAPYLNGLFAQDIPKPFSYLTYLLNEALNLLRSNLTTKST